MFWKKNKIVPAEPLSPRTLIDNFNPPSSDRDPPSNEFTEMALLTPGPVQPAIPTENDVPTTSASLDETQSTDAGEAILITENDVPTTSTSQDESQSTDAGEGPSTLSTGITVSAGAIIDPLPPIAEDDGVVPTTSSEASIPVRTLSTTSKVRCERGEASAAANVAKFLANRAAALAEKAEREAAAAAARELQGGDEDEIEVDEDEDTGAADDTPVISPHSATEIITLASAQQIADDTTAASSPAHAEGIQPAVTMIGYVGDDTVRSPMTDGAADVVSPTSAVSPTSVVSPTSTVVQSDASRQPSARPEMMLSQAPTVHGTEEARKSANGNKRSFWKQLVWWCCDKPMEVI